MNPTVLPAVLATLLLAGCGDSEMTDLKDYVAKVKAREPKPIAPLPEIKPVDTFVYEPDERRDPFVLDDRAAEEVAATAPPPSGIAPDPLRRKEELEQYPLDALRMLGTLQQKDANWGLILSPDGTLHRVSVGNYMGKNNGQVIRVSDQEIELTEIVPDGVNSWRERPAAIALSQ